jgi:hypothetical protein
MRHCRQGQRHRAPELGDDLAERRAEWLHETHDLRAAAARQDEELERVLADRAPLSGARPQLAHALDERMPDVGAGRPPEAA